MKNSLNLTKVVYTDGVKNHSKQDRDDFVYVTQQDDGRLLSAVASSTEYSVSHTCMHILCHYAEKCTSDSLETHAWRYINVFQLIN